MLKLTIAARLAGLLCAATLALALPATAAEPADAPTLAAPAGQNVQMSDILSVPSNEELKKTKDEAKLLEETSQNELGAAREREARYRARVEIRKSEADATKGRIDLAKKDGNKDAQATLEATKKRQDLEVALYQKMAEIEKTNGQVAEAARLYGRSRQNTIDLIADLGAKYYQRQSMLGGGAPEKMVQLERQVRDTEKKALEALKDTAEKQNDWTSKQKDLADRRMDAFNAMAELLKL